MESYKKLSTDVYARYISAVVVTVYFVIILKLKPKNNMLRVLHVLSGLLLLYVGTKRDFYLPFLGYTVFPCEELQEKTPENATLYVKVSNLPPNVNVVFWASEPSSDENKTIEKNPWEAYKKYANSGVVRTNDKGEAELRVRDPSQYKIPSGRTLDKHVHYRYCVDHSLLSPVQTIEV